MMVSDSDGLNGVYRLVYDSSPDALMLFDSSGVFLSGNVSAIKLFGCIDESQLLRLGFSGLSPKHQPDGSLSEVMISELVALALKDGGSSSSELVLKSITGVVFPASVVFKRFVLGGKFVLQATVKNGALARLVGVGREKLSGVYEKSPLLIILTGPDGSIEYVNPKFTEVTGYTSEEVLGKNPRLLKSGETSALVYHNLWTTINAGLIWRGVFHNRKKDGSTYWASATIVPIVDEWGKLVNILAMQENITSEKLAEEKVKEYQSMLQRIIDLLPTRIFWKDKDLKYLGCNLAFARDAGVENPSDLIGKSDFDVSWKDQAELYRADDKQVMDSGVPKINYEEPQSTPQGDTVWLLTTKVPLINDQKQIVGVIGTYSDITSKKKADEETARFNEFAINRELKMVELKGEVNSLLRLLGKAVKYNLSDNEA